MIIRGTTPYHNFILPLLTNEITAAYITYLQNDEIILEKTLDDEGVTLENIVNDYENASMGEEEQQTPEPPSSSQLTIHLTQEDTLKFHFYPAARKNIAVIQIRILAADDEAYASEPVTERIFGVLHDGVIPEQEEVEINEP